MATTIQPSVTRLYSSAVACLITSGDEFVAYVLRRSGMIMACNLSHQEDRTTSSCLYHHKYSINVEVCGAATYMVVLS